MATILFESQEYLGVDKPEGISCIPERDLAVPSLIRSLEHDMGSKLFTVHRLDKEASGVIVFAKTAEAHRHLNDLFASHKVEKRYLLLVHGVIAGETGRIEKPIREFGSGRMGVDKRGKPSVTEFQVIQRWKSATLVEATPKTGRRHQLRVHFYAQGNAIVGDARYGDKTLQSRFGRLMLHASHIGFDTADGSPVILDSPVPDSFRRIIDGWRDE